MRITDIAWHQTPTFDELLATAVPEGIGAEPFSVWFRVPSGFGGGTVSADPFVAGFLIPCMFDPQDLQVDASISPLLLARQDRIQDIITTWFPEFTRISVRAGDCREPVADAGDQRGVGCSFSAGVDSWYTFLRHEPEISHLLLFRGSDILHEDHDDGLWTEVLDRARRMADGRHRALVTVETNIHEVTDKRRCTWGRRSEREFYMRTHFGGALSAMALVLQDHLRQFYLPASYTYRDLFPFGSHPLLDPLWSTERLAIVHDGCEADRHEKTRLVAQHPDAMAHLRVCAAREPGRYNCSACEKCYRTMASLRLLGLLDQAPTFEGPLDLRHMRRFRVPPYLQPIWKPVLLAAEAAGDRALARSIRRSLGWDSAPSSLYRRLRHRLAKHSARRH